MDIAVEVDDEAVVQALRRLQQHAADPEPAMQEIAELLRESSEQSFDDQQSPDGRPWAPLKPATARRKQKKGYSSLALVRDGFLRTLTAVATPTVAVAGSNLPYAAVHHFGSKPDSGQNIPARPYLGLRPDYRDEIVDAIRDHLRQAWTPSV